MTDKKGGGSEHKFIPAYEGNDILSYILSSVMDLYPKPQKILSITNVRDMCVIITDANIFRVRPMHEIGWCVESVCYL